MKSGFVFSLRNGDLGVSISMIVDIAQRPQPATNNSDDGAQSFEKVCVCEHHTSSQHHYVCFLGSFFCKIESFLILSAIFIVMKAVKTTSLEVKRCPLPGGTLKSCFPGR